MDFLINHMFKNIHRLGLSIFMAKNIRDNYRIYGLIIIKSLKKKSLDYELSNVTVVPLDHAFTLQLKTKMIKGLQ